MSFAKLHLGVLLFLVNAPLATGLCSTCLEGLCHATGECTIGCMPGYVGEYCDEDCPTRCLNDECYIEKYSGTVTCTDGCEPGYCGTKCTNDCPGDCVNCDRQCGTCNITLCPERRYGADCSDACSSRYEKCDRDTGQCIRCRRGYYGDECTKVCKACFTREDDIRDNCLSGCKICQSEDSCLPGFYGNSCKRQCSTACTNSKLGCNKATGECFDGCSPGYHGLNCTKKCNEHCLAKACDQKTGVCSSGCLSGFKGKHCNRGTNDYVDIIFLVVVIICLAVGSCVIIHQRNKKKMTQTEGAHLAGGFNICFDMSQLDDNIEDTARNPIDVLRRRTKTDINSWIVNKVRLSAEDSVVNMMKTGRNWLTITGNAGDGKTTLGYQVLQRLLKGGYKVYHVKDPEEYKVLLREKEKRVVMFDECFGTFTSDQVLINKWREIFTTINNNLDEDEHQTKVIFVSRKNVLKEAMDSVKHLEDTIMDPDSVVDLSAIQIEDDRLKILDHYLKYFKIKISSEVKQRLVGMKIAYGFPQCCKMYAGIKSYKNVDIEDFFKSPLMFLDITTTILYNGKCNELFRLMIMNNGSFDANTVEVDAKRNYLLKLVRDQEGRYITALENGHFEFAHSSIYEIVLRVICKRDPLFCVKYATLNVIRQKLVLVIVLTRVRFFAPTQIKIKPVPTVVRALAARFRPQIVDGDYTMLSHAFCDNETFLRELLTSSVCSHVNPISQARNVDELDQYGKTMLLTAFAGKKKSVVKALIQLGANVNKADKSGNTLLLLLCKQEEIDFEMIKFLIETGKVDCNIKDANGKTALHYLCERGNFSMEATFLLIREGRGDVNQGDERGNSPLHLLCGNMNVSIEDARRLIQAGSGDVCKQNNVGQTSQDILATRNVDMMTFVSKTPDATKAIDDEGEPLFLSGSVLTVSSESEPTDSRVNDRGWILTNVTQVGTKHFWKFIGIHSSVVDDPISPTYWQIDSELKWKGGKVASLIEIGVVDRLGYIEQENCISPDYETFSVSVVGDCHQHKGSLCIQMWKQDHVYKAEQVGECITLYQPIPNEVYNFSFGTVLDVARGRIAFIDVEKQKLLFKIDQTFTKDVFPILGVNSLNDCCAATMKLVAGNEISLTDKKKELIRQALLD